MMVMGYCNCSPYFVNNITTYTLSGTTYTDNVLFTSQRGDKTGCQNRNGPTILYCFGDQLQTECGFIVSGYSFQGGVPPAVFNYGSYAYDGNYANAVWVDNTFAADSSLVVSAEKNNYGYLGCFNSHYVTSPPNLMFIPFNFVNTFTTMSDCFSFCAGVNMAYAGLQSSSPGLVSTVHLRVNLFTNLQ